jgi:hypothetical protein
MDILSDSMRLSITKSGYTLYALGNLTGIDQTALGRFVRRERGMTIANLDKLAAVLGWKLVVNPATLKKEKKRAR